MNWDGGLGQKCGFAYIFGTFVYLLPWIRCTEHLPLGRRCSGAAPTGLLAWSATQIVCSVIDIKAQHRSTFLAALVECCVGIGGVQDWCKLVKMSKVCAYGCVKSQCQCKVETRFETVYRRKAAVPTVDISCHGAIF